MAKNVGLIKISGKVGDLQFFNKDGNSYVGLKSGVSKERIEKDPVFKRTRENMAEFGGSAGVSKNIRDFLIPLKSLFEKNLHARFTSLIRRMINLGSGARGKRRVEFSLNQEELTHYELNSKSKVSEIIYANMDIVPNAERNQAVLTIDEFLPSDYLLIPEGATHYKVHLAALSISDFAPQGVKSSYKPLNTAQHGLLDMVSTAELTIDSAAAGGITLTVNLPGTPTLGTDVSLFTFIGIEFLQGVNGSFYQLASNNAIRIEKVF